MTTQPEPADSPADAASTAARPNTRPAADWVDVDQLRGQERAYLKDSELQQGRVDRNMLRIRLQRAQSAAVRALDGAAVTDRAVLPDGSLTTCAAAEVAAHR